MTLNELRHRAHVQEVEKKIKLLQMNWFIRNHEEADDDNSEKPKSTASAQTSKLVKEIQEIRTEIKEINAKLNEYQKELNAEASKRSANGSGGGSGPRVETEITYMYPVPSNVKRLLYTGISSNAEGRYRYLKTRNALSPDEKYRVCPTYNFKYGWDVKKQGVSVGLKHGKTEALARAIVSVHGITLYDNHPTQRPPNSQW